MKQKFEKPLHLLIDGRDKVGKSTVCHLLSRKLDLPIIKMPNMKEYFHKATAEEFSKLFNETIVQFSESSFILDRGFPSSMVYSKVFARDFDLDYIRTIQDKLKPIVIILDGTIHDRDDIKEVDDKTLDIHLAYRQLADDPGNDYILLNVTDKTPTEVCNEILEKITSLEEESRDSSGNSTILTSR